MAIPVGILVRISDDREDERKGVTRQGKDCRDFAAREEYVVVETYTENDTSAFKRRRVTLPDGRTALRVIRPEFRRMLDDLQGGRIKGLVAYDLDRVVRDPRDLEDLIDVAESTGYPVRSVTGSLQLDNDGGITNARVLVAMANKSSRDTARRVQRAVRDRAEAGKYHGGKPKFGYQAVMKVVDGRERVVRLRPHRQHAAWVREAVARVIAGETLYSICVDWNDKGRRTDMVRANGEATHWSQGTLRRIVTSPAIAGYREHNGQRHEATEWQAIVDRDDWTTACEVLKPRTTRRGNGNARKYKTP